jgi:hypothetical protein
MNIQLNINIDDRYINNLKGMLQSRRARIRLLTLLLGIPLALHAAPVTIPNTFATGGVIYASQVNANFTALANQANANDVRIGTLETGLAAKISPIAYGFVAAAGGRTSGSTNWSSVWNAGTQWYEITITGESYSFSMYTTIAVTATGPYTAGTNSVSGKLILQFWNQAGASIQPVAGFQFVTFK